MQSTRKVCSSQKLFDSLQDIHQYLYCGRGYLKLDIFTSGGEWGKPVRMVSFSIYSKMRKALGLFLYGFVLKSMSNVSHLRSLCARR